MITEAVQEKLAVVLAKCYADVAPESATAPFIVHIEKGEPIRSKNGLEGYTWDVEVVLITLTPATRETYTASIISAIEGMTGTTVKSTNVDEAFYVSDTPMFDEETGLYGTNILFNVITKNR
jgi:hypothetical protein